MSRTSTLPRRSGIALDAARLDYELGRRGITARRLSEVSGVPEATISQARHGRPVAELTLRRITKALLEIPLLVGADMLVVEPEKRIAGGSPAPANQEVSRVSGATSKQV